MNITILPDWFGKIALAMLLCIVTIAPSSGMGAFQPVEIYLRLVPDIDSNPLTQQNQCKSFLAQFSHVPAPTCRTLHARQGILILRWSNAIPDQVASHLQTLKLQGLVQWFEIKQSDLKLQSLSHGNAGVAIDPAFWSALKPSAPESSEPWFVSDDIRRLRAWNSMMEVNGQVVVAVIDSGVNFSDPALAAIRWQNTRETAGNEIDDDGNGYVDDVNGWDFVSEGYAQLFDDTAAPDNDPADTLGHGTAVAQIMRAVVGSALADLIRLMPLRVAYGLNGSGTVNPAALAEAIYYAADNGAHIVNISLGGAQRYEVVATAIQYALGKGAVVVAAAGNSGSASLFPANLPGVLAVGALDRSGVVLASSARGQGVDIFASGVDMLSPSGAIILPFQASGTSFAAPVVSAALAMLQAVHLGADAGCQEQRQAVLSQLPFSGQLDIWLAFQLQRSERARQPTNTPDAWQKSAARCGAPASSLSSLVRNS